MLDRLIIRIKLGADSMQAQENASIEGDISNQITKEENFVSLVKSNS